MKARELRLGDVIDSAPTERARRHELPILSMTMHDGLVDQASKFKKRIASSDTSDYKVVRRDQLVVGFPIDEGVLSIQDLYDAAIVSPAYDVWDIRHLGEVHPPYLERFLRSSRALAFYRAKLRGTTARRRTIPDGVFLELRVPLPLIEEQRRIAAVLDKADALRAKRRAALAQLDTLAQAIFLDMFGDAVTNPRTWPVQELREIGTVERGVSKHRPRNAPKLLGGPYPLVQTGDVANSGGYITAFSSTYSELGLRQSRMWPAGTLCITIAANIAKTGILTFDACFPDSVVGFRAESATVEFVRVWLSFLQAALEKAAPESAQKNINLAILRNLRVPLAPLELRAEFERRIQVVNHLGQRQREALNHLNSLFASLQHRAFRGEL